MKRLSSRKTKKKKLVMTAVVFLAVIAAGYSVFSYHYFYYRMHHVRMAWPENNQVYRLNPDSKRQKTYVALGDSLTYAFGTDDYKKGWTYATAEYLSKGGQGITLENLSHPGWRVNDIVKILDQAIAEKPDIVTLLIGVNDTHRLAQVKGFDEGYDLILSRLSNETKAKIYVINLPYLGAPNILLPPYSYYLDAKTKDRNKVIKSLANKYGATYIDLYFATSRQFKKSGTYYSKDLYHPSAEGYKIWADTIDDDIRS